MFKKTILDNGLTVITAPQPGNLAFTVLVLTRTGSKYETKENSGISHFLEHMVFKGTKKRPTALQIKTELDGMGSVNNAFTAHEMTGYYIKAEAHHIDEALDLLSDIYLNPVFDEKEIEKERGAIIGEIDMDGDNPMSDVHDRLFELMYGDQPAGWNIAGSKENVNKLSKQEFIDYYKNHYVADATTVVVAGKFDESKVIKKIDELFKDAPVHDKAGKLDVVEGQESPQISIKEKDIDQNHIMIGFRACNTFDEGRYALGVLSDILGGGASSRLSQSVREELGAGYYIYSFTDLYTDHGYLAVAAGLNRDKFIPAINAILNDLEKIKDELVPESELRKAKNSILGGLVLGLERSNDLATFYGEQEVVKRVILTPKEIHDKIEAVTAEDVREVARDILRNVKMNLMIIGKVDSEDELKKKFKLEENE